MKKILKKSFIAVVILSFITNYFIRVSSGNSKRSSGIIINYIKSNGILKSFIIFIAVVIFFSIIIWLYHFIKGMNTYDFWKKVSKNPNLAYHWFLKSSSWKVLEYPLPKNYKSKFPENKWSEPFDLFVPEINSRIKVIGELGEYEKTRKYFLEYINKEDNYDV